MNKSHYQTPRTLNLITLLVILIVFAVSSSVFAGELDFKIPDEGNKQILKLNDGSSVVGTITEVSDTEIEFQTDMGLLTIEKSSIKEITEVPKSDFKGGQYWYPNPNQTRLFIGPTGRMLKQGEGYLSDVWVFFPSVAYGLTDNITMGFGITLFPGVDFEDQLKYFTPKLGIEISDHLDFAVSALIMSIPFSTTDISGEDDTDNTTIGTLFGVGTFGSADHSFTLGLGYGFVDDELADKPVVLVGGETRISRKISIVTENWVFPGDADPIISGGIRLMGERMAIDFAYMRSLSDDAWSIPYLDFVYNF